MEVTVLGCGTSFGVPMINCDCPVCSSDDPRNVRTRASILISTGGKNLLVDTATDLRAQAIANKIDRVDAVLYTHAHAEHLHGIDELRRFNWLQHCSIPCYGNPDTMNQLKESFPYIFVNPGRPGWQPNLTANDVKGPFELFGRQVTPVKLMHGEMPILGYRIGGFAYVTDFIEIPDASMELLEDLDVLMVEALRFDPHPTHVNLDQALEVIGQLSPKRAVLTHMAHTFDYAELSKKLPEGVEPAYDGMRIIL